MYFVTVTTAARAPILGTVIEDAIELSDLGRIVHEEWVHAATSRRGVELDLFVVMPNHFHGLVLLLPPDPPPNRGPTSSRLPPGSLGAIVGAFKSASGRRINDVRRTPGKPVWQRNYHDRIVRNDDELDAIRAYIYENPERWSQDPENPDRPTEGEARLAPTGYPWAPLPR